MDAIKAGQDERAIATEMIPTTPSAAAPAGGA